MSAPSLTSPLTGSPPTGILDRIKALLTGGGSYWATLILVLGITIALFSGIFYIYTPSEVVPLAAGSTIATIVLILLGVLYKFSGKNQIANTITRFAFSLYFFMPYGIFTFGIVSDAVNRRLQYFPAGLAGFTGILFNYALSLIATGGAIPPVQNALCEIPGLSSLSSTLAPQSMMFTLSALAYIATYINRSNIGGVKGFVVDFDYRWPSWVLFISIATLHALVLRAAGCLNDVRKIAYGIALPLLWGGILGLVGFSVLEKSDNRTTPGTDASSGGGSSSGTSAPAAQSLMASQTSATVDSATCSANAEDGEFTCE